MTFKELGIIEPILKALEEKGYTTPTPIQEQAILPALQNRDVLGLAQTGTGKTAAFALPIIQQLYQDKSHGKRREIKALILTPTRELAIQIHKDAMKFASDSGLRFALVYGQGGTVFDHREHMLVALGDMRDACARKELHRAWMEHSNRSIVRVREVDFDPSGEKPGVTCNLFAGWPTVPREGNCDKLLQLLWHMCGS